MANKKVLSFEARVAARLNKSDKEVQKEKIQDTAVDYRLCIEDQISNLDREIPREEVDNKKALARVKKATAGLEDAKLNLSDNSFDHYIARIRDCKAEIISAKADAEKHKNNIEKIGKDKADYEALLAEMA